MTRANLIVEPRLVGMIRVRERQILWVNQAFASMMIRDQERLIMQPTRILYPDERTYAAFSTLAYAQMDQGETFRAEIPQLRGDGSIGWFDVNCGRSDALHFEHIATFIDVTEKRKLRSTQTLQERELRRSEETLRTIFSAMTEGVVFQGRNGNIIQANTAAERILGLSHDQLLNLRSLDPRWRIIHEDGTPFPGNDFPSRIALRTGVSVREQIMGIHTPAHGLRWISVNSKPIYSEDSSAPAGAISTFIDVTANRDSHERIRQLAQHVELVREEERRSMAQILHEGIAQDLFAAQLALKYAQTRTSQRVGLKQAYEEVSFALAKCMESIRALMSNDLWPVSLAHERLSLTLSRHAQNMSKRSGLAIRVNTIEPFPELDEAMRLLFFRAAQEAIQPRDPTGTRLTAHVFMR